MFRVEWDQSALDELTTLWTQADPDQRQALTSASHDIDQRLRNDPQSEGESRSRDRRITFIPPLAVTFMVEVQSRCVVVLHVRMFRRKSR